MAGQSIEAPPLPGDVDANGKASVAQQNALSLVFMILNSKATQKGELHFNVLLEHVDVRWATHGIAWRFLVEADCFAAFESAPHYKAIRVMSFMSFMSFNFSMKILQAVLCVFIGTLPVGKT